MGKIKGKVQVTVYLPEKLWERIRQISPDLPTGKKKVSDLVTKLIALGLEAYGANPAPEEEHAPKQVKEARKKKDEKKVYKVEVDGVKLFLKPVR